MSNHENRKILVIEDDPDILFAVSAFLEMEGYSVATASNGAEGLQKYSENGGYDLILLDMRMPVMDGWQFAAEFRKRYGSRTPILVMTAAADAASRATEIRADGFIEKPFNLDRLAPLLEKYLRPNGRTAA